MGVRMEGEVEMGVHADPKAVATEREPEQNPRWVHGRYSCRPVNSPHTRSRLWISAINR